MSFVLSIFLLSIGTSFIQRTTGFGFGIFIMTMLPFFMPSDGNDNLRNSRLYHSFLPNHFNMRNAIKHKGVG